MSRSVGEIVLARAEATTLGRVAYSTNPDDFVQFENVMFSVIRSYKSLLEEQSLTVERVAASGTNFDADGGSYVSGEDYILFLEKQQGSDLYYLVNDQGRFRINNADRLQSIVPGDQVADEFDELTLKQFDETVTAYVK